MFTLHDGEELVGWAGFQRREIAGAPEVELGWLVRKKHWGKGYASEAALELQGRGPSRLIHLIHPENAASIAVAKKLGARARARHRDPRRPGLDLRCDLTRTRFELDWPSSARLELELPALHALDDVEAEVFVRFDRLLLVAPRVEIGGARTEDGARCDQQ